MPDLKQIAINVQIQNQTLMAPRGGGFWGNVTSGLGMGAGFGVANALIGGIFNAL